MNLLYMLFGCLLPVYACGIYGYGIQHPECIHVWVLKELVEKFSRSRIWVAHVRWIHKNIRD